MLLPKTGTKEMMCRDVCKIQSCQAKSASVFT